MKKTPLIVIGVGVVVVCALCAVGGILLMRGHSSLFSAASNQSGAAGQPAVNVAPVAYSSDPGWPRKITSGDTTILMYDPLIDKWDGDEIDAYAAVSVESGGSQQLTYGQVYFSAHAVQDKTNRTVTLDNFKVTKGNFPTATDKTATYVAIIQQAEANKSETVPQDQIQSDLAIAKADRENPSELKNDPPRIIFSTKPAVLVLIDGQPALRPAGQGDLQRVINTRALILFDQKKNAYYLSVMNGWVESSSPEGPWTFSKSVPGGADRVRTSLAAAGQVDLLNGEQKSQSGPGAPDQGRQAQDQGAAGQPAPMANQTEPLRERLKDGSFPTIYVSTVPAELLTAQGDPQFKPLANTSLLYMANSGDQIFMNTGNQEYYTLVSGRWFEAKSMDGPWQYVNGKDLPSDFAKIPQGDPKANVLASVPGTAAAQEASIENQIPETATINRQQGSLTVTYDGNPQFQPIPGTHLQNAANSATPVLEIASDHYMAVQDGVWFTSTSPLGPWVVATDVPPEVYSIPPSSPVHNVTYVRTYGYTPDVVYTGYTPGYYGTVVEPDDCVAYGTGWYYSPYIGSAWYGWPGTYGLGVGFGWTLGGGWGFGFGAGFLYPYYGPWWGPVGFGFGFPYWGFGVGFGWGGWGGLYGGNLYGRWGRVATIGARAGWGGGRAGGFGRGGVAGGRGGSFAGERGGATGGARGAGASGGARGGAFGGASARTGAGGARSGAFGGANARTGASARAGTSGGSRGGAFGGGRGGTSATRGGTFGGGRGGTSAARGGTFGGSRGATSGARGGTFGGSRGGGFGGGHAGGFGGGHGGGFGGGRGGGFGGGRGGGGGGGRHR
jgi:hypothetical protein